MSYVDVNGLHMYYEVHGTGREGARPLVLLHGAFSGVGTSFGAVLPGLAAERQVYAVEFQAHAHTADIDRPLRYGHLASDVVAMIDELGIGPVDLFGYSVGGGVALEVAVTRPELVGRLVIATPTFLRTGFHPEMVEGVSEVDPAMLHGSPYHDEYLRTAPDPDAFPVLCRKVGELNASYQGVGAEAVRAIGKPALLVAGDSDIVRPEHVVEMFRLFGGGQAGDIHGLPASRMVVLPGTTHTALLARPEFVVPMVVEFLAAG